MKIPSSLKLFGNFIDGKTIFLFALIPLFAVISLTTLRSSISCLTIMDLIIWSYDPSYGIPLLWFICPIVTIVILLGIWKKRSNYNITVRETSHTKIWLLLLLDCVIVSGISALLLHITLFVLGITTLGVEDNFSDPSSLFSFYTDGQLLESFSFTKGILLSFVYCFLSLTVINTLFCFLNQFFNKPIIPFLMVATLNLPAVHGSASIIYDVMRNVLGGNVSIPNPLSFLYETAGIFYATWLPGQSHNFLFLILVFFCLATLGLLKKKQDYL